MVTIISLLDPQFDKTAQEMHVTTDKFGPEFSPTLWKSQRPTMAHVPRNVKPYPDNEEGNATCNQRRKRSSVLCLNTVALRLDFANPDPLETDNDTPFPFCNPPPRCLRTHTWPLHPRRQGADASSDCTTSRQHGGSEDGTS